MSKLWEVDPETKAKLLEIQKQNGNNICVDCGAPSPQWASPKFGIFMCLNCSGIHRGLGVHITFIRSVTMDGFKVSEVKRMQLGGNKPWQEFFNKHADNEMAGKTFEDATIKERYDCDAAEEYKERLSAKVEDREYVPGVKSASTTASGNVSRGTSREQSLARSSSPATAMGMGGSGGLSSGAGGRKAQNEAYFARMGEANASRPEGVAPAQGGKYSGFGSSPAPSSQQNEDWIAEMQKDPLAGLTKGFGWLGRSAKTGYDGWVKPNVQKLAESDLTHTALQTAAQLGQGLQGAGKTASDGFTRFVEGTGAAGPTSSSLAYGTRPGGSVTPDAERRDFWDSFGTASEGPDKEKREFWDSFGADPDSEKPAGGLKAKAKVAPPDEKKDFWESFGDVGKGGGGSGAMSQRGGAKSGGSLGTAAMKRGAGGASAANGSKKDDDWNEW